MKKNLIVLLVSSLALCSCEGFLDMTPTDRVSPQIIWGSTEKAEYNLNFLYSYIWDLYAAPTVIGLTESLTDELKYTSYNYNAMCYIPSEMAYGGNVLTPSYVDSYMGYWGTLYTAIGRVNEAILNLHTYGTMSDEDKVRLEGELKFLRGWMYFELIKRYKEVIIYEDIASITKDKALSTEEEGWDQVEKDLRAAAVALPLPAAANGRLNQGTAWGMLSRAMLYAKRWDVVIEAADEVTKLGYDLTDNYADSYTVGGNKEAILQYFFSLSDGVTHSFNFYYTPGGDYTIENQVGGGYAVPTQEMVESYELAAGGFPDWSPWHADDVTATPPYADLEPRFQATILYNGASWKNRTIEPYIGGTDGWATWKAEKEPKGKTVTGYYLRKLVDESYDINTSGSSQCFTFLRYAEVLLNQAEAYVMSKTQQNETEANKIIEKIRGRVNLPYTYLYGSELMAQIRQERKVELAYEGLRYWDLRRWELAATDYPQGLCNYQQHGLKIEKVGDAFSYSYVSVDEKDRSYPEKMYRFPLPESEISNNKALGNQQPDVNWRTN
ncbi:MAG: RagB/SusD family nutrient uptake outer membrane protein [Candidatus Cryptobacteroides sp.]